MIINAPRGTKDIFGVEMCEWKYVENIIHEVSSNFGLQEIRTPMFEHTELFIKGVGDNTDIVNKEMYTFNDKGSRSLTLRPEGTAPVVRAFIEHKLYNDLKPKKFYYINNTFRYERPQAGRMREFKQYGVEIFGSNFPECEAEVISIAYEVLQRLGLKNIELRINTLGDTVSRKRYNEALKDYINNNVTFFCNYCKERNEVNTLRVLDCKNEDCQKILLKAPSILDFLSDEAKDHFSYVKKFLKNLKIPFIVDSKIVRGLDYYTKTVFEFISNDIGAKGTICGGGRYDNLIEQFGGPITNAVGFGMGMDRLIIALRNSNKDYVYTKSPDIFIGGIGENGIIKSQEIIFKLRKKGIFAEGDILHRNIKAQLRYADKINAKYSVILGEDEIKTGICKVKNMNNGKIFNVETDKLYDKLF